MMTQTLRITAATRYTLWIKKTDREGKLRWYPKRRVTRDFAMAYAKAEIDYGTGEFFLLPENMKPQDAWLIEAQPAAKSALYSVWTEGKNNGANKQRLGEHLDQEEAQHLKQLTEASPLALGLRVWIEEENNV